MDGESLFYVYFIILEPVCSFLGLYGLLILWQDLASINLGPVLGPYCRVCKAYFSYVKTLGQIIEDREDLF